jgi:hypothetical protein
MVRWLAIGATVAVSGLATFTAGNTIAARGHVGDLTVAQAHQVVVAFFRSQNERRYDRTCALLSDGFYAQHRLPDKPTCIALLRVSFMWSGQIQFRIGAIEQIRDRFVVHATANGTPGQIVLERDGGHLRILTVRGE